MFVKGKEERRAAMEAAFRGPVLADRNIESLPPAPFASTEILWDSCMTAARDGTLLATGWALPADGPEKPPIVVVRTPYTVVEQVLPAYALFCLYGYGVVVQQCRGRDESKGEWFPFVNEREDGLALLDWIRSRPFYGGELYLAGGSYLAYVHLCLLDAAGDDVKGAALSVMPPFMHKGAYTGGMWRHDIYTAWTLSMCSTPEQNAEAEARFKKAVSLRPAASVARELLGWDFPWFTDMMLHSDPADPEWTGGHWGDYAATVGGTTMPLLLIDGYFEMYLRGMTSHFYALPEETRAKSAFLLGPWEHGSFNQPSFPFPLPNGNRAGPWNIEAALDWFEHLRTGRAPALCEPGKVTYYLTNTEEGSWRSAEAVGEGNPFTEFALADGGLLVRDGAPPSGGSRSYRYDPENPASLPGGASRFATPPAGLCVQPPPDCRPDVISFLSEPLGEALLIEGRMRAELVVSSDCPDTAFIARVIAVTRGESWIVQETGVTLSCALGEGVYREGERVRLSLEFDPLAFLLREGDRLRVDVTSSNVPSFAAHGNTAGPWALAVETRVAENTVYFGETGLFVPVGTV